MNTRIISLALLAATASGAMAQEPTDDNYLNVKADVRFDYTRDWTDGTSIPAHSGFQGKYLNVRLDGTIVPGLSYSWRQRFNKFSKDSNFFDATDWIQLTYTTGRWNFSGGKQVVAIGGWEYDRAPIDLYSCSVFWNHIPCYDFGVSVAYDITPADQLKAQVTQSPFFTPEDRDMYAYNIFWSATHGCWQPLWSVNMVEYARGKFINYIALGNKFSSGDFSLEADFMNRAASGQTFLFKDCSVMAELSWRPNKRWNVFGKYTYDVNRAGTDKDLTVANGTEMNMAGAGVEFFPLRRHNTDLRLHADLFYAWGTNTAPDDMLQNKTMVFNVGIKWNINLVSLKRK